MAKTEVSSLIDLVRAHVLAEDRRDVEATVATMTKNCSWSWDTFGVNLSGREEVRELYATTFTSFPDFKTTNTRYYDSGDDVFAVVEATFTHDRDWNGIPATGKRVTVHSVAHFARAPDGLLSGEHVYMNGNDLLYQLGALPSANALDVLSYVRSLEQKVDELKEKLKLT